MQKRAHHWTAWLTIGIALSVVLVGVYVVLIIQGQPTEKQDLKNIVSQIRSEAAEGQLMAEQVDAGTLTTNFLRVHAQRQQQNLQSLSTKLTSLKIGADLENSRSLAQTHADNVNQLMGSLITAPSKGNAHSLKDSFSSSFTQLVELENSLKE